MSSTALAGATVLLGNNVKTFHDRIRDHLEDSEAVLKWLDCADQQLDQLLKMASEVLSAHEREGDDA